VFSVYLDESKLVQSVYVHKLNHTDIRVVHHSLVDRKNCLGIYYIPGQSWSPTSNTDPLYLHFPHAELMNNWMALLRTYAIPEVYGRWNSANDGGLYRMWREVQLKCVQGRNLGTSRPLPEDNANADPDGKSEPDAIDLDVYCEIYANSILSGRTTTKKCIGNPEWSEEFNFTDLAPFDHLEIVVFRERKLMKPMVVGSILVYLINFRRGETVEGWFPVVNSSNTHVGVQLGELRLKMRVDEEIILPSNAYAGLHKVFQSRNFLDWIGDFEAKFKLKDTIDHVMAIAQAHDVLADNIMELANREVDGTHMTHNTLFRGNTVFTKTMEKFMVIYGRTFLEASLGSVVRRLCAEKVAIEVDPNRTSSSRQKGLDRNVEALLYWCGEFWNSIYEARHQCPSELRRVFAHIRQLVKARYAPKAGAEDSQEFKDLPWQSVSSFLFLRFMVPAILHPHNCGFWPGLNEEPVNRSLTLIAKVIHSLANLNTSVQKEDFMHNVKDFLAKHSSAMLEYADIVSTPRHDQENSGPLNKEDKAAERSTMRVQSRISQRSESLRRLHREAIRLPPHMLDAPMHYASIASLVVRYSRRCNYHMRPVDPADTYFDSFYNKCMEVEEQALARVSELAKKPRREYQPVVSPVSPSTPLPPVPSSPISMTSPSSSHRERKTSLQTKRRRSRRTARPSTAPGDSEGRSRSPPDALVPSSPTASHTISRMFSRSSLSSKHITPVPSSLEDTPMEGEAMLPPPNRANLGHHPRSTSTDSALFRSKHNYVNASSNSSVSHVVIEAVPPPDGADDKKRKGLLRGILRRGPNF